MLSVAAFDAGIVGLDHRCSLRAVFIFDAVWAKAGFIAAAVLVAIALFILKKWDDRRAARDREASSAAEPRVATAMLVLSRT